MEPLGFDIRPLGNEPGAPMGRSRVRIGLNRAVERARGIGSKITRKPRPQTWREWRRFIFKWGGIGFIILILYILFLWFTLPDVTDPKNLLASQSTVITDRNDVELYRLFNEEDRTFIEGDIIPLHMKQAIIAIEDERFYDRGCVDVRAIGRAIFTLGRGGGASTITRQLARNALNLYRNNRYVRKVKELMLGCQLEGEITKDELLELYLNWIPFGENAYGIEQASQRYFSTSAEDLTLAQSAVLASLPQAPSYYSPYRRHRYTMADDAVHQKVIEGKITKSSQIPDDDVAIGLLGAYVGTGSTTLYVGGRSDQVLKNMQDQGYITEQERLVALEELEEIEFRQSREDIRAAHFVLWVRDQVEELFAGTAEEGILERGGLTIQTTLDWDLQEAAEAIIERHREDITDRFGGQNMALIALQPQTKEVLAYVGNMDYNDEEHGGKIDMVHAPRQPGSSFKPFVYAAAFQKGYGPATPLWDVPTKIGDNEPQNFDGLYRGLLTIRQAIGESRNIPAAKAFFLAGGEDPILGLIEKLGAPSPLKNKIELGKDRADGFDYGWPLALGSAETPLIEMVHAYSTFASGGMYQPVVSILRITDKKGNLLYESDAQSEMEQVLDPRIAYQITSVLSDISVRPDEYWKTQLSVPGFQTAAKTGTSNKCMEWKDENTCKLRKPDNAWVVGYTPQLAAGVWVGNADSSAMYDKAGGLNTASPFWHDFMARAHRILPVTKSEFPIPDGVAQPQISMLSGQLPTACTPVSLRRADVFLKENAPTEMDPDCVELVVDRVTGLLSSPECPVDALASGSFLRAHSVLPLRWPQWEEGVQEWVSGQMDMWNATPDHSGATIPLPIAPTSYCDPELTPGRMVKPEVEITFPRDGGIATFPSFRPKIDFNVGSEVLEVTYILDGHIKRKQIGPTFDRPIRVPASVPKGGTHTLEIILVDEYYNMARHKVSFRFEEDKSSPTVRITAPAEGSTFPRGAELTMRAEASDPDGGIKYVQFFLDDLLLSTKPKEPFELTYTLDHEPGEHIIKAVAVDMAKNEREDGLVIAIEE